MEDYELQTEQGQAPDTADDTLCKYLLFRSDALLFGAAADYAAAHGADCPLNRAVVDAVHGIERGERRLCADNLKVFRGIV